MKKITMIAVKGFKQFEDVVETAQTHKLMLNVTLTPDASWYPSATGWLFKAFQKWWMKKRIEQAKLDAVDITIEGDVVTIRPKV